MTEEIAREDILPLMLGTAGHVDHGKTSLVRRLTGFDTDQLKEEKARGMSIDFAVAPFDLPGVGRMGIIDVPGHEDFIHNMVSGASSIDVLLLVVAADDAVMPQTVEHLRIAKLLGMSEVLVAVSKIDLVDEELFSLVREDVRSFLNGCGYDESPVIGISSETGQGFDELKTALARIVPQTKRPEDTRAFRMYARHVFTMKGHGTVVTGVPVAGSLSINDSLSVLPSGKTVSVRGIQTYRQKSERTHAHVSSAVNLRDVSPGDLERGMALCAPGVYRSTTAAAAWITNDSDQFVLKRKSEVRILCGTVKAVARALLIEKEVLGPGESCFVRFVFSEPVIIAAGDRFVVRELSPAHTLGGGRFLSTRPGRIKRQSPFVLPRLGAAKTALEKNDHFSSELNAGNSPLLRIADLSFASQKEKTPALSDATSKEECGELLKLSNTEWLVPKRLPELIRYVSKAVARYHRAHKYSLGMKTEHLASILDLEPSTAAILIKKLCRDSDDLEQKHGCLALRSFSPQISQREIKLREDVLCRVEAAGSSSAARGPIQEELQMSNSEMKLITKILVDENLVSVIGGNLMIRTAVEECRRILLELFRTHELVDLKLFREASGMSRNIGVALLEAFDSEGMTKRQGNARVLKQKGLLNG